jgi:hypothetical protein
VTAASLRGKVVVVQLCTYSCINWLRTLPYVRAWAEKYGSEELTVLGVRSPEFAFDIEADRAPHTATKVRWIRALARPISHSRLSDSAWRNGSTDRSGVCLR